MKKNIEYRSEEPLKSVREAMECRIRSRSDILGLKEPDEERPFLGKINDSEFDFRLHKAQVHSDRMKVCGTLSPIDEGTAIHISIRDKGWIGLSIWLFISVSLIGLMDFELPGQNWTTPGDWQRLAISLGGLVGVLMLFLVMYAFQHRIVRWKRYSRELFQIFESDLGFHPVSKEGRTVPPVQKPRKGQPI
jgi:hypothetical protein